MDSTDWYNLGTIGMVIGGFFSLLETGVLDPLIQYRYNTFNVLQYCLFALIGALGAVLVYKVITQESTLKKIWSQGKTAYKNLTGKTDTEINQSVDHELNTVKGKIIERIRDSFSNARHKAETKAQINLASVKFPTPRQLYQEVMQPFTSQILATNVEPLELEEQPIMIDAVELDSPEGLEPVGSYQRRAMIAFFSVTVVFLLVNLVVRYFPLHVL